MFQNMFPIQMGGLTEYTVVYLHWAEPLEATLRCLRWTPSRSPMGTPRNFKKRRPRMMGFCLRDNSLCYNML